MTSAKISVQLEQKSLCFKSQLGKLREPEFLAFRFPPYCLLFLAPAFAGGFARGGGR